MSDPLHMEAETLCDVAEKAAEYLEQEEGPCNSYAETATNLRKIIRRLRSILHDHPEAHNDDSVKAQFHREVADEKGLLR
jgi:hypothetical protein